MNTWNTLLESYLRRVYKNTLATAKRQIQQAENPMPGVVITMDAACVDNAILDHSFSGVAREEHEIWSTDLHIPIDNNITDDKLHFGMPQGTGDHAYGGDSHNQRDAIRTTSH